MQRIVFGTQGNDQLTLNGPGNLFGLAGDNTLIASNSVSNAYVAFMVGGEGNTHYVVNSLGAIIVDTGGHDTVTLPGSFGQYTGAYVNGEDLTLINTLTGQEVFIVDAKSRGRMEAFRSEAGEVLSGADMEQRVYNQWFGDISYAEYSPSISASHFLNTREVNKAWADMDWNGVWQTVAQMGDLNSQAVASVISDTLVAMLSPSAQQHWQGQMGLQQLAASLYEGVEQNLPAAPGPVLPHAVIENIALIYEAALNRQPDEAGLNYWIDVAMQGQNTIDIAGFFIQSDEFITNFDVTSDESLVDRMYLNVLERSADDAGKAYWLDQMNAGLTQAEVLNYFAVSEENIANAAWLSGLQETENGWEI